MKTSIERWRESDGDNTYAIDWDLNEDSHVWEIGGFEGRWAQQIWDKFHFYITIFEPQLWAVEKLEKRFEGINKIGIRDYGLWVEKGNKVISNYFTDGASITRFDASTEHGEGEFRGINSELHNFKVLNSVSQIDLCLMNIEGGEFSLMPYLSVHNQMVNFNNFWCQFHPGRHDEKTYYPIKTIYELMEKTHDLSWDFFPTAVAWRRK